MTYYAPNLPERGAFTAWRTAARRLISHRIAPEQIDWTGNPGLFAGEPLPDQQGLHTANVPEAFLKLAQSVIWHSAPERFALLYEALWRLDIKQGAPLSQADPLGRRLNLQAKAVGRDIHKMHAFVRFRELPGDAPRRRFVAWFEPEHHTLEPGSRFFANRFADMDWVIATPRLVARFEAGALGFHPPGTRPDLPEDASEALWATYFANIFNPARIKLDAMRSEMPKKYWKNLPETSLIPSMLADAEARVTRMHEAATLAPRRGSAAVSTRYRGAMKQPSDLPETLEDARDAALHCRRCALCEHATQTVWGRGPSDASLMVVGEQPGDREDLEGRPFVGPSARLLSELMAEVGIDPARTYFTNAVKHFKFAARGTERIQQTPDSDEINQCRWWLGLELAFVRPRLVLVLGASAVFAMTGDANPLPSRRGRVKIGLHGGPVLISRYPALMPMRQGPMADALARRELTADLREVARFSLPR
ncbi:MAG: UdgX family uracil-DNA binding protein [Gluconacetobacter liquefaciens]